MTWLGQILVTMIDTIFIDVAKIAWLGLALELFELLLSFHGFVAMIVSFGIDVTKIAWLAQHLVTMIETILVEPSHCAGLHLILSLLDQLIKVKILHRLLDLLLSFHGLVAVIVSFGIDVTKIAWLAQLLVTMIDAILIDVAKSARLGLFFDLLELLLSFHGFVAMIDTVLVYVAKSAGLHLFLDLVNPFLQVNAHCLVSVIDSFFVNVA